MKKEEIEGIKVEFEGIFQVQNSFSTYAIRLREAQGSKYMNILVGYPDANLISIYLEGMITDIPQVHQLLLETINSCKVKVDSFLIEAASDNILFSSIFLSNGSKMTCRPADGIALAILSNVNMYIEESIFDAYGVEEKIKENANIKTQKQEKKEKKQKPKKRIDEAHIDELYQSKNYIDAEITKIEFIEQMNNDLQILVENEEFEKAAEIRDRILAYQKIDFLKTEINK